MKGTQRRLVCPSCGKVFFAWRPDDLPGANVKCYLCGHQFADEAARRPAIAPAPEKSAEPASAESSEAPPAGPSAEPG